MADEEEDERPWTEQQWEDFMRQADLRTARYGELMETLFDHPDREEIIDHEMGWDRKREGIDEAWMNEVFEAATSGDEDAENDDLDEEDLPDAQHQDDVDSFRDRELDAIPAYAICERVSIAIDQHLVPLMKGKAEYESDEDVAQAYIQIKIAGAKIAAGHGMGYEDEVLGGNVVNCKRSLAAVEECELALKALSAKNLLPAEVVPDLLDQVTRARQAVADRIAELRGRMWWQ